ncbi:MAG: kinase subunit of RNA polymerase II carboxy-terminal domain kinase I [Vezdaea aestivalis]|nr:MAG: kinase subunit of RNA polymerase II carboxy-terminal domain kinase I [Vezdaea aestivalis]
MSTTRDDLASRDYWRREDTPSHYSRPERSKRHSRSRSPPLASHKREKHKSSHHEKPEKDYQIRAAPARESRERRRSKERARPSTRPRADSPSQSSRTEAKLLEHDERAGEKRRRRHDSPKSSTRRRHSRSPSPEYSRTKKSRRTLSPLRPENPNSLNPDLFAKSRKYARSPDQISESKHKDHRREGRRRNSPNRRPSKRQRSISPSHRPSATDRAGREHSPKYSKRPLERDRHSHKTPPSKHRSHQELSPSVSEIRTGKRSVSPDRVEYRSDRNKETSTRHRKYDRSPSPRRDRGSEKRRSNREASPLTERSPVKDSLPASSRRIRRSLEGQSRSRSRSPRKGRDSDRKPEGFSIRTMSSGQYYPRSGPPPHKDHRMPLPSPRPGYGDMEDPMMTNGDPRMREPYPPPMHRDPLYLLRHTLPTPMGDLGEVHPITVLMGLSQSMQPYQHPHPYRQSNYPPQSAPQSPYYHTAGHGHYSSSRGPPYPGPPYDPGYRSGHYSSTYDRRYSSGPPPQYPSRGRGNGGHFNNLHWNANSAGRGRAPHEEPPDHPHDRDMPPDPRDENEDNMFRSRDMRGDDASMNDNNPASEGMQGDGPEQDTATQDKSSKFSFAFKSRTNPVAGPRSDFATKMRESASRSRPFEPRTEKRIQRRLKARPYLPTEFTESDSVYFRRPGNESVVGSGTYGKVFKAIHVYTNELVALKKIRMEGERDGFPVTAVREIKLLQSLRHDNVVSLQEVMVEKNDCFMVFEYLSHDLTGLLNHPSFKLEDSHKKHLAKQLFDGLDYLHRRGVLHRDIKAANILVSNEGQLKLADFGLARFFAKRRQLDYTNRVITIWYRSPELLLGETQYGPAVDVWSAACVMIEIFTRHAIFPGDGGEINQLDKIYDVLGTPNSRDWPGLVEMQWFQLLRPSRKKANVFADRYKERITPAAFDLLESMFQYDPAKRPNAGEVLEHPYFKEEKPRPQQAKELRFLDGDWHEFESKALRKENERNAKEARRAAAAAASSKDQSREKEKRRASSSAGADREIKRARPSITPNGIDAATEVA